MKSEQYADTLKRIRIAEADVDYHRMLCQVAAVNMDGGDETKSEYASQVLRFYQAVRRLADIPRAMARQIAEAEVAK